MHIGLYDQSVDHDIQMFRYFEVLGKHMPVLSDLAEKVMALPFP